MLMFVLIIFVLMWNLLEISNVFINLIVQPAIFHNLEYLQLLLRSDLFVLIYWVIIMFDT